MKNENADSQFRRNQQLPKVIGRIMGLEENVFGEWRKRGETAIFCLNFTPHLLHEHWALFCTWLHDNGYGTVFEEELRAAMAPYKNNREVKRHEHVMNTPLDLRCCAAVVAVERVRVEREKPN